MYVCSACRDVCLFVCLCRAKQAEQIAQRNEVCLFVRTFVYVCKYMYACVCMYVCICIVVCVYVCITLLPRFVYMVQAN